MTNDQKKKKGRPRTRAHKEDTEEECKCKECDKNISEDKSKAMECEICNEYICLECTGLSDQVYNYLVDKEVEIPFICKPCKEEIPKKLPTTSTT